jgi:hypothetical protein
MPYFEKWRTWGQRGHRYIGDKKLYPKSAQKKFLDCVEGKNFQP